MRAFSAFGKDDVEEVIVAEGLIGKSMVHSAEDFGFTIELNEAGNFFEVVGDGEVCCGEGLEVALRGIAERKDQITVFKKKGFGPRGKKAFVVIAVFDETMFFAAAGVLGNEFVFIVDGNKPVIGLEGKEFGSKGKRNAVAVGLERNQTLGSAFDGTKDAGIVGVVRQAAEGGFFFFGKKVDGSLFGSAVNAAVGNVVTPGTSLAVTVGERQKGSCGKKVSFHIANTVFHRTFFVRASHIADRGSKQIVGGKIKEAGVELNGRAETGKDDGFEIIITNGMRNAAEELEGANMGGHKVFQRL